MFDLYPAGLVKIVNIDTILKGRNYNTKTYVKATEIKERKLTTSTFTKHASAHDCNAPHVPCHAIHTINLRKIL